MAFEEGQAYVTLADGSLTTLKRLNAGAPPAEPRTFTNGRLTFVQDVGVATGSQSPSHEGVWRRFHALDKTDDDVS